VATISVCGLPIFYPAEVTKRNVTNWHRQKRGSGMNAYKRTAWIDVRSLRLKHGWLQSQAAERLGISREYLSAIENGKRGISLHMMEAIMQVFDVKYEDFYTKTQQGQTNYEKRF
jgi:DNA-binding XRE family transcriptional regulator